LNKLMTAAKQRKFDAVLVWKLDRFGRSLKHLVSALGEFEALGIAFVSLRDIPQKRRVADPRDWTREHPFSGRSLRKELT